MGGMHCKLYDENLVYNIIMATGNAAFNFLQENNDAELEELYDYLERHADSIIEKTIEQLNGNEKSIENDDSDLWSPPESPSEDSST
ncbi:MAG: hypothetical protein N2053_01745 [Chitinispirillaceae bacterium]|nr:hypothetical protein [Chitinispirillaceae bacterium]